MSEVPLILLPGDLVNSSARVIDPISLHVHVKAIETRDTEETPPDIHVCRQSRVFSPRGKTDLRAKQSAEKSMVPWLQDSEHVALRSDCADVLELNGQLLSE